MPQSGMTAPPRGEPSVPASITAKFMVRQSRKKVHLTTKFSSVHGRKLGSPCGRAGAKRLRGGQQKKRPLARALRNAPVIRGRIVCFLRKRRLLILFLSGLTGGRRILRFGLCLCGVSGLGFRSE